MYIEVKKKSGDKYEVSPDVTPAPQTSSILYGWYDENHSYILGYTYKLNPTTSDTFFFIGESRLEIYPITEVDGDTIISDAMGWTFEGVRSPENDIDMSIPNN